MRKYLAIGYFKGYSMDSKNMTCVAMEHNTKRDFYNDLKANAFVLWVIITEKKLETLKNIDSFDLFNEVKKMTSNYRVWEDVTDYIEQCLDIMDDKMQNAC